MNPEKKNKHMTLEDRIEIQECLYKGMTFKNYLEPSMLLPEYDFWYAQYYDNTPNNCGSDWAGTGRKFGMWQYTQSKNIAPITANTVDCNVAYKNYPLIIKSLHLNNF